MADASPDRRSSGSSNCWRGCRDWGRVRRGARALHLIRKREELLGAARRGDARRAGAHRDLLGLRQCRHPRSLHDLPRRAARPSMLVVVETVGDLWALERAGAARARYHVLGGVLSPLDGVGPDDLNLASLVERVARRRRRRSDPRGQRHGRRPDDGALHHRSLADTRSR